MLDWPDFKWFRLVPEWQFHYNSIITAIIILKIIIITIIIINGGVAIKMMNPFNISSQVSPQHVSFGWCFK